MLALYLAARDRRTPALAKAVAGATAAYALSPIDLVPDFIPVLGLLDDLLIVPAGVWLALRLIPPMLMAEFYAAAARVEERPVSRSGMLAVLILWLLAGLAGALILLG